MSPWSEVSKISDPFVSPWIPSRYWSRVPRSLYPFSTPHPTQGDAIDLPDVPSTSATKQMSLPSWANTPALDKRLEIQTYHEAERVFGHGWLSVRTPGPDQSESESFSTLSSPSVRPGPSKPNADSNEVGDRTKEPLPGSGNARQLRPRFPVSGNDRDNVVDLAQANSPGRLPVKPWRPDLSKTALARPPRRKAGSHRIKSNTIEANTAKTTPATRPIGTTQARISSSYQNYFPAIPLQFGLSHEGSFNPYRVNPNQTRAILDETKIRTVSDQTYQIADKIPFCLHDSEIVDIEADMSVWEDLNSSSGWGNSVLDVARKIDRKIGRNKDIENLLSFFHISVLRVYQWTVGPEEVCVGTLLHEDVLIVASSTRPDKNSVSMKTPRWTCISACMESAVG